MGINHDATYPKCVVCGTLYHSEREASECCIFQKQAKIVQLQDKKRFAAKAAETEQLENDIMSMVCAHTNMTIGELIGILEAVKFRLLDEA